MTRPALTAARLRAGAILAALRNGKTLDLRVNPSSICVKVPPGCDRVRLALRMRPDPALRVSGLGLHADIRRNGSTHRIGIPWHSIVQWRAYS